MVNLLKISEKARSGIAALALLLGECAFVALKRNWVTAGLTWLAWSLIALAVLVIPLLAILSIKDWRRVIPNVFTKLLSNTVAPSWLGIVYLVLFLMHFSWATDGLLELIFGSDNDALSALAVGAVGISVLTIFFPSGRAVKDKEAVTVIISGMSTLRRPPAGDYNMLNLRPLVSPLRDMQGPCEMLIMLSKDCGNPDDLLNFLQLDAGVGAMERGDKLRAIVRAVAKREFPDKQWIDDIPIRFTRPCDYDDFAACSKELIARIKAIDDVRHRLVFNLTPGTAVVSSLMTLLSIDANRELFYYNQNATVDDEDKLTPVDKSTIPMRGLLSQALESLET